MKYLTLLLLGFAFLQAEETAVQQDQKPTVKPEDAWVAVTDESDEDAADADLAQDDSAPQDDCGCGKKKKG
jgi:hypothetical protein